MALRCELVQPLVVERAVNTFVVANQRDRLALSLQTCHIFALNSVRIHRKYETSRRPPG